MTGYGMDLGTAGTVVCDRDGAFLFDEPTIVVRRGPGRRDPVLVGWEADEMAGRIPVGVPVRRPVHAGVLADPDSGRDYLRTVVRRALPRLWARARALAVLGVPVGATVLEKRALLETVEEAGIGRACALDAPVAGGLGSGIDPLERRAHMVADIGAGTAEAAVFSCRGLLAHRSSRAAGDRMTDAVTGYLRERHGLVVDVRAAEALKSAPPGPEGLAVAGRDAAGGRPRTVRLAAGEVHEVIDPVVAELARALAGCLDDLPPRALDDVLADGLLLCGGASLTPGLEQHVEAALCVPVKRAENPATCVAEGAARAAGWPEVLDAYALR